MLKNIDYKNKEYDNILEKIFSKKKVTQPIFEPYFLKGLSSLDKKNFLNLLSKINTEKIAAPEIIDNTKKTFSKYLTSEFSNYLVDYLIGYRELSKLMNSNDYEEIMINYYDKVFVFSRDNQFYKTNIVFEERNYSAFIKYLKDTLLTDFDTREFIDGILPDRSRINIVSKSISGFNVITIRKYLNKPLNIIDLIKNKEITPEIATYLWIAVDGLNIKPANLFICGGTSTGKTTLLNALLDFIPFDSRIIGVEDTLEIDYSNFENYVCLSSNISDENSLYDISVNIMRMRPDRIIIGETRGKEVRALFLAMSTGHEGCLSTIHGNNVNDLLNKLSSNPFNIDQNYLSLLNVVVTLKKVYVNKKINRFVSEISEISKIGNITTNEIYSKENSEKLNFMASSFFEKICEILNIKKTDLKKVIEYRLNIITKMVAENVTDTEKIRKIISENREITLD